MSTEAFAERILRFVQAKGYKPQELAELAQTMGIGRDEHGDFHDACKALMKTGRVIFGSRNAVMLPDPPGKIVGSFRRNERGFGFVIPDAPNSHGDLYVPGGKTGDAITGDTVVARVLKRGKRSGKMIYEGRIIEIVKRGRSRFVGELRRKVGRWFVIPDGNTLHVPIVVGDPTAKGARAGDQVVVEIFRYPEAERDAEGVIVKAIGRRGEPGVDTLSIIEQHQLPGEFGDEVLEEAREAVARFDPKERADDREDLGKLTVITIDPADAKDFDDAISLTTNRDGTKELGIHIADVAHFVRPGSALDREARARSNSVYLPRTVIPMLPEVLSNGVCSLQERQPRLTKSVFITYGRGGSVKSARLANTIIRSTKRLTYEQASAVLDGKRGRMSAKVVALLLEMERLARTIHKRRLREGMLELDLPDVELVFDKNGNVVDVEREDTSFSHKIIEMFMVEANEAVARRLDSHKLTFLRRVHDKPSGMAIERLQRFLAMLGHDLPEGGDGRQSRFAVALQKLLKSVRGRDDAFAVNLAVLRSMQRAEYAPVRVGHYALASKHYTHFTSPIRRYPDLTIHRLMDYLVRSAAEKRTAGRKPPRNDRKAASPTVAALGKLCSTNERRAEAAERELKLVLVLRLLEKKHLGDEFEGIVTGVANMGVFVQLDKFLIDGLLRFDRLSDDWWEVDANRGSVVGERTGHRITVGDRIKVVIARIHVPTRQMVLEPASSSKTPKREKKRRPSRLAGVARDHAPRARREVRRHRTQREAVAPARRGRRA